MDFAKNLQTIRKSANLSQEQLADQLHLSRQAVSKWEMGQSTPDVDTCIKLCDILKVTPNQLLLGPDEDGKFVSQTKKDPFASIFVISSFFLMVVCICGTIMLIGNLNRSGERSVIPEIHFLSLAMIRGSILVFAVMFIAALSYWRKKQHGMGDK